MSQLYSFNNEWPQPLPFRVNLPNGLTRTDPATYTPEELLSWGYTGPYVVPPFDDKKEVLEWSGSDYTVRQMTQEEQQAIVDQQWIEIRYQRNQLLLQTDWTQLPDSPVDATPWAQYRQQLRDITTQDDPFNIAWPVQPN